MSSRQTAEIPVSGALRALVIPRSRLLLVLATALVGLLVAFALAIALPADQRTFSRIVPLTQLIISVLTPFSAALLTHDLRDSTGTVGSRWVAAALYGLVAGGYGAAVSAAAVAAGTGGQLSTIDPWVGAWSGRVRQPGGPAHPRRGGLWGRAADPTSRLRGLATIAVPLAASFVLGRYAPTGTTEWVTPLGAVSHLLPGPMSTGRLGSVDRHGRALGSAAELRSAPGC